MSQSSSSKTAVHEKWMRRCFALAAKAKGSVSPNPRVGSVVVGKGDRLIAKGVHGGPGTPHGEAVALARAGSRAKGATLYVNLEPCIHHGRTPPCAPAVLASGVRKVVFGARDPIAGHGGGAAWLRRKGVEVVGPVLEKEAKTLNRVFFTNATQGRPHFVLKAATSLDARIATRTGQSKWITGKEARADGRRFRAEVDGILVGVNTILADDPRLNVRIKGMVDPVRIVLDSRARVSAGARIFGKSGRTIVATTKAAGSRKVRSLENAGAEVWTLPSKSDRVSLRALGKRLLKESICSVLVEGGAVVHGAMVDTGLADELLLYLAPKLLGGEGAKPWTLGLGPGALASADDYRYLSPPTFVGRDLRFRLSRE